MTNSKSPLTEQQLKEAQEKLEETKAAAEKVETVLRKSAISLVESKESMIVTMLQEKVDLEIISQATGTPIERILEIQQSQH